MVLDHRGLDEVALAVVAAAAGENRAIGAGLGEVDVALVVLEGALVDDRREEVPEVRGRTHLDLAHLAEQGILDLGPEALRDIGAGGGGALLALEFEGAPDHGRGEGYRLGTGMGEMKSFPPVSPTMRG